MKPVQNKLCIQSKSENKIIFQDTLLHSWLSATFLLYINNTSITVYVQYIHIMYHAGYSILVWKFIITRFRGLKTSRFKELFHPKQIYRIHV